MTQTQALLLLLRQRGAAGVTPLYALDQIGTLRLGARVFELRHEGYDVRTEIVSMANGKKVAKYVLYEKEQMEMWG